MTNDWSIVTPLLKYRINIVIAHGSQLFAIENITLAPFFSSSRSASFNGEREFLVAFPK